MENKRMKYTRNDKYMGIYRTFKISPEYNLLFKINN